MVYFLKIFKVPFLRDETLSLRNELRFSTVQKSSQISHTCTVLNKSSASSSQSFVPKKQSLETLRKVALRQFYDWNKFANANS